LCAAEKFNLLSVLGVQKISRLDYCNSVLSGLPSSISSVLHTAAHLIKDLSHGDHGTPIIKQLQQLASHPFRVTRCPGLPGTVPECPGNVPRSGVARQLCARGRVMKLAPLCLFLFYAQFIFFKFLGYQLHIIAAHARTPTHTNTHTTINENNSSGIQG